MSKVVSCRDVGMDCDFVARGQTETEILEQCAEHARTDHGMTEIPGAFSNPFDGPHKLATMGKPGVHPDPSQTWTQARILDDEGHDVPEGTVGELAVKVPTLMQGYYRDPEQTRAAFRDGRISVEAGEARARRARRRRSRR